MFVIGVIGGLLLNAVGQQYAQRLVQRRDGIGRVCSMVAASGHVPTVDDSPMAGFQNRMMHIGVAAALSQ